MASTPRRNRVTPWGEIVAVAERGGLMGNRGVLVNEHGQPTRRRWTTHGWIACSMSFGGRKRPVAPPGRWTALFFLDDAAAHAAGHRPCGYCRRIDYLRFKRSWSGVHGCDGAHARAMDERLHRERTSPRELVLVRDLPDDAFVGDASACFRVESGRARRWSWTGYGPLEDVADPLPLLTPRAIVAMLGAGYTPSPCVP